MHNCKNFNEIKTLEGCVCDSCGLMLTTCNIDYTPLYGEYYEITYSKDQRQNITLQKYIITVLNKLKIPQIIHNEISTIAFKLIKLMYSFTNYKGAYLKKALIIITIYKLYNVYSYNELISYLDLNIKYISKAEMCIAELISTKHIPENFCGVQNNHPIRVIYNIIHLRKLQIPDFILSNTNALINKCLQLDFTSEHQPSSIAISCLYFVIKKFNIDMDIKLFCNIYNLSNTTITKVCDKIKTKIKK